MTREADDLEQKMSNLLQCTNLCEDCYMNCAKCAEIYNAGIDHERARSAKLVLALKTITTGDSLRVWEAEMCEAAIKEYEEEK
jgi:hypothetical protein